MPGVWNPVTQRGSNCQDVFVVDDERCVDLAMLKLRSRTFSPRGLSMTNFIQRGKSAIGSCSLDGNDAFLGLRAD